MEFFLEIGRFEKRNAVSEKKASFRRSNLKMGLNFKLVVRLGFNLGEEIKRKWVLTSSWSCAWVLT